MSAARLWALTVAATLCGCATTAPFVWVDEYRPPADSARTEYLLGPGDVVAVRVHEQEAMSAPRAKVRTDGRISLPMLNDVEVAGRTPAAVAEAVQARLKTLLNNPVVTVTLEEARPFTVSVLGEVARPGVYPVEPGSSVLHALALAGGLTQYAHEDRIFVLRADGTSGGTQRIRFDYRDTSRAKGQGAQFTVRPQDIVVVE